MAEEKLVLTDQFVMRVNTNTYSVHDFVNLARDLIELKCLSPQSALFSIVKLKSVDLKKLTKDRNQEESFVKPLTLDEKRIFLSLLDLLKIEHYLKDTLKYKMKNDLVLDSKNCALKKQLRPGTKKLTIISNFIGDKYFQSKGQSSDKKGRSLSLALFTESVSKQIEHEILW